MELVVAGAPPVIQAVDLASAPATTFAQPVTVTLTFASSPGPVTAAFWNPSLNAWQPIADLTLAGNTVSFTTRHFTVFAIMPPGSMPRVDRLAGLTRIETAVQAAKAAFPDGAQAVVLANAGTGAPSPDALAAAGLAGAVEGPILLTAPDHVPAAVLQTIQALGATTVYVVGGPAAVSDTVVSALQQQGLTVVRDFEGLDRFQTAALIDAYLYLHHLTQARSAFVANGATMVDALSASPVLFRKAAPLILVNSGQTTLPAAAWQAMKAAGIQRVVILGGPAAVTAALQQAIAQALPGVSIVRYGGLTRNQTAVAFDQAYFGPSAGGAVVAANGLGGSSMSTPYRRVPWPASTGCRWCLPTRGHCLPVPLITWAPWRPTRRFG